MREFQAVLGETGGCACSPNMPTLKLLFVGLCSLARQMCTHNWIVNIVLVAGTHAC